MDLKDSSASLEEVTAASSSHHVSPSKSGLLSNFRLFSKGGHKKRHKASGQPYRGDRKGGIQSEPPSFTGYSSAGDDQDVSSQTSPKTSRPDSSSGFFQQTLIGSWQHTGNHGEWSNGSSVVSFI